jgi:hypothetical protein
MIALATLTRYGKETLMEKEKLALNKEVLRQLGDQELKQVVGGTFDPLTLLTTLTTLGTTTNPPPCTGNTCSSETVTTSGDTN